MTELQHSRTGMSDVIRRAWLVALFLLAVAAVAACRPLSPADDFPGVDLSDPEVGGGMGADVPIPTSAPLPTLMEDTSPRLDEAARATVDAVTSGELRVTSEEPTTEPLPTEPLPTEPLPTDPLPTDPPQPEATESGETIHIVQPGENLYQIGLIYGLTWQEIAEYNDIANPDAIDVGQEIKIPKGEG